jgi:YD repeat-containing protein
LESILLIIIVLLSCSGITASAVTVTYTYDSDGQLLKADYSSGESLTYAYDAAGNILTRVVAGGIPQTFALTVSKSGSGTGTVTSDPTGISCGATCNTTYNEATGVTLTATPDTGSSFTGWSGACSGTGSCVLTMDGAKTVTATFILNPIDGVCGAANGQVVAIAPAENLCSAGTATSVDGAGPWTWNCEGANGGTTAACSADLIGACGAANGETYTEAPTDFLCSTGTATDVTYSVVGDDSTPKWTWQCKGTDGVSKVDCSANKQSSATVINGACGSANGQVFTTAPVENLCSAGTASALNGSNPWTWSCAGANGGVMANCSTASSQTSSGVAGDVNNDKAITLADAIMALQILSGMTPAPVNPAAGVNNSGRVGLMEALFALQKIAGLREAAVDPGVVTGTKSISVAASPPFYGFTFASGSVAQASGDFMVTAGNSANQSVSGLIVQGMMQDLGLIANLETVTEVPASGYTVYSTPGSMQLTAGHAYAFQLSGPKYGIIVVKSVTGSPTTMTFDYKYQPSGSRTF